MSARFSTDRQTHWRTWGRGLALVLVMALAGAPAWADGDGKVPDQAPSQHSSGSQAQDQPEITAIAPAWGPSGWVFSLTVEGRNLTAASEVRFYPSTGIVVEEAPVINEDGTVATVKVTILVHAPIGPRLVVVSTPAGRSSLTPTEANTFKVSFAHLH